MHYAYVYLSTRQWPVCFTAYSTEFMFQILKCISQLELAQLIGTGVKKRFITRPSGGSHAMDQEGERFDECPHKVSFIV